jgi:hypothetical protein
MSTSACDRTPVNPEGAAKKPYTRRTAYVWQPTAGVWVLTITHFYARKAAEDRHYFLSALASDWGRAFALTHLEADGGATYHVNLTSDGPCCDCKGFVAHRHCKHEESLRALDSRQKLAAVKPPAVPTKPAPRPAAKVETCDGCGLPADACECAFTLPAAKPAPKPAPDPVARVPAGLVLGEI